MIYENRILKKAGLTSTVLSLNDYLNTLGFKIIELSIPDIDESVEQNAKEILKNFRVLILNCVNADI